MSRVDFPNRLNKVRRQLNHILNDHRYYQNDSTREFTISMYNAFGKSETITLAKDKIVFMTDPKDEILKSYEQNTSRIIKAPGLITESKVPKL